jgi:YVTN family beta-propeller protein
MGIKTNSRRALTLLAVFALVLGIAMVYEMQQDADAATYRTLPTAAPTPQPVRATNLSGLNFTGSNNLQNSSLWQLQIANRPLPTLSAATSYVLDEYDQTVSVIDGNTHKAIRKIATGDWPTDMAWNQAKAKLYVVNKNSGTLTVIDTATDVKTGEIDLLFPLPEHLAVSPDGSKIYVAAYNDDPFYGNQDLKRPDGSKSILLTVDAGSGRVTNVVSLPFKAGQLAISPDGGKLFVLAGTDFGVLDVNTWKVLKAPRPFTSPDPNNFAYDVGGDSTCLALSPDGKWLYVTNTSRYNTVDNGYMGMPTRVHFLDLDQVDAATYQVKRTVKLNYNNTEIPHEASAWGGLGGLGGNSQAGPGFTGDGIAVSPDGWLVVVTSYIEGSGNYGTMNALYNDNGALKWAGYYAITSATPEGVAITPDGRTLVLANGKDQSCSFIESGMGKESIVYLSGGPGQSTASGTGTSKVLVRPGLVGSPQGGLVSNVGNGLGPGATGLPKKGLMPGSIQASPSVENGLLYVCNNLDNTISLIDLATGQVNATIDVYKSPTRVAVTPDGKKAFAIDHVTPASSL